MEDGWAQGLGDATFPSGRKAQKRARREASDTKVLAGKVVAKLAYINSVCESLLADAAYKRLPKSAKSSFAPAAKRVKELMDEAQPKLSEELPEKMPFDIAEVNAVFSTAESAVATVKSLMQ